MVNNVAVAPATSMGTKLDDSLVTGKVKAALMDAADVKSLQINVETRDGVVQLAGFVASAAMKDKAGRDRGGCRRREKRRQRARGQASLTFALATAGTVVQ